MATAGHFLTGIHANRIQYFAVSVIRPIPSIVDSSVTDWKPVGHVSIIVCLRNTTLETFGHSSRIWRRKSVHFTLHARKVAPLDRSPFAHLLASFMCGSVPWGNCFPPIKRPCVTRTFRTRHKATVNNHRLSETTLIWPLASALFKDTWILLLKPLFHRLPYYLPRQSLSSLHSDDIVLPYR